MLLDQERLNAKYSGGDKKYEISIDITRYDEGDQYARCLLIGLGQMYLNATITIKEGNPPTVVKAGTIQKNYMAGGYIGYSATMRADITSKLAGDISEAIDRSLP